jgi:hypothetical protein
MPTIPIASARLNLAQLQRIFVQLGVFKEALNKYSASRKSLPAHERLRRWEAAFPFNNKFVIL